MNTNHKQFLCRIKIKQKAITISAIVILLLGGVVSIFGILALTLGLPFLLVTANYSGNYVYVPFDWTVIDYYSSTLITVLSMYYFYKLHGDKLLLWFALCHYVFVLIAFVTILIKAIFVDNLIFSVVVYEKDLDIVKIELSQKLQNIIITYIITLIVSYLARFSIVNSMSNSQDDYANADHFIHSLVNSKESTEFEESTIFFRGLMRFISIVNWFIYYTGLILMIIWAATFLVMMFEVFFGLDGGGHSDLNRVRILISALALIFLSTRWLPIAWINKKMKILFGGLLYSEK
ncbi:MAG: hypothetical protein ACK5XN_15645 [Bacteroidota bacterium]|jgi:hypothetical protein